MALEDKPAHPLNKAQWQQGGPPGAYRYRVRDGDNWWNLAKRDRWSDVWGLIDFNFKTRVAKEVNWYLRDFVGCNVSKDGGKNWSFSASASPGYIYTKYDIETVPVPPPSGGGDYDPDGDYTGPLFDSGWWFGFGIKGGLSTFDLSKLGLPISGVGADVSVLQMVSMESLLEWKDGKLGGFGSWNRFVLNVDSLRYNGGGLGGGGVGLVMGVVQGFSHPDQLRGYRVEGSDFNVAVGPLKGSYVRMAKSVTPLFKAIGKNIMQALKNPATWDAVALVVKGIKGELELDGSAKAGRTSIQIYDLPVSVGVELSSFDYSGMTQVLFANYRSPRQRWESRQYPDL